MKIKRCPVPWCISNNVGISYNLPTLGYWVECRIDPDVIDETPAAYKDIDAVMAAQSDLVDIVHTLKQVVCVKG